MAETHIAGLDVRVGSRLRQRCSWCGAVLVDVDLTRVAVEVPPDGSASSVPTWTVGALVARDGSASWVVEHVDGEDVPADCCAALDADATA